MSAGRPFIDLSALTTLRTLCLHGYIWTEDHFVAATNNNLPTIPLRTLTAMITNTLPPRLEYLTLLLFIQDFEDIENSGLKDAGWAEFVRVLEGLTRPPKESGSGGNAGGGFMEVDEVPNPSRVCLISLDIIFSIKNERGDYVWDLVDGWVGVLRTRGATVVKLPGKEEGEDSDSDGEEEEEEEEEG